MAQMPRGEPRTVPDPIGDLYNDTIRRKRLQDEQSAAVAQRRSVKSATEYFSPFDQLNRLPVDRQRPEFAVVNGRLVCTTPLDRPPTSPEVLEAQRRAVSRISALEDNPLGANAYGLATLLGAPPPARDAAFAVGALGDAAGSGFAFKAPAHRPAAERQGQVVSPTLPRDNMRLREVNANGQATGVTATVIKPMLGTGRDASRRLTPPGWLGDGKKYKQSRGHLLGRQLGGPGGLEKRNFVTLTQTPTNSPQMRDFENNVADRVRAGEVIEYSATPLYNAGVLPPGAILLTAQGSRGTRSARVVFNPAGRRR